MAEAQEEVQTNHSSEWGQVLGEIKSAYDKMQERQVARSSNRDKFDPVIEELEDLAHKTKLLDLEHNLELGILPSVINLKPQVINTCSMCKMQDQVYYLCRCPDKELCRSCLKKYIRVITHNTSSSHMSNINHVICKTCHDYWSIDFLLTPSLVRKLLVGASRVYLGIEKKVPLTYSISMGLVATMGLVTKANFSPSDINILNTCSVAGWLMLVYNFNTKNSISASIIAITGAVCSHLLPMSSNKLNLFLVPIMSATLLIATKPNLVNWLWGLFKAPVHDISRVKEFVNSSN